MLHNYHSFSGEMALKPVYVCAGIWVINNNVKNVNNNVKVKLTGFFPPLFFIQLIC